MVVHQAFKKRKGFFPFVELVWWWIVEKNCVRVSEKFLPETKVRDGTWEWLLLGQANSMDKPWSAPSYCCCSPCTMPSKAVSKINIAGFLRSILFAASFCFLWPPTYQWVSYCSMSFATSLFMNTICNDTESNNDMRSEWRIMTIWTKWWHRSNDDDESNEDDGSNDDDDERNEKGDDEENAGFPIVCC